MSSFCEKSNDTQEKMQISSQESSGSCQNLSIVSEESVSTQSMEVSSQESVSMLQTKEISSQSDLVNKNSNLNMNGINAKLTSENSEGDLSYKHESENFAFVTPKKIVRPRKKDKSCIRRIIQQKKIKKNAGLTKVLSDRENAIKLREKALAVREATILSREAAMFSRETALWSREAAVSARETAVAIKEDAVSGS